MFEALKAVLFGARNGPSALKGILHSHERPRGTDKHIRWRQVLTAQNDKEADEFNREIEREMFDKWSSLYKLIHLLMLMYEELALPVRVAYPAWVIAAPFFIAIDVVTDIFEMIWVWTELRENYKSQQTRRADGHHTVHWRYTARWVLVDVLSIVGLYATRAYFILRGDMDPFRLIQLVRLLRVYDLTIAMEDINQDLSTNVTFLSVFKFSLVLVSVPHWVGCVWWLIAEQETHDHGPLELPSWPAQLHAMARTEEFTPGLTEGIERYLMSSFMAWGGVTAMGYAGVMIANEYEVVMACLIAVIQIVFYAFVLGTLFHYLVRTDENVVHFKALIKTLDTFIETKKLPDELAELMRDYFEYRQKKAATGALRVIGMMPHALRFRYASEQYMGHCKASWCFFGTTEQLLGAIAMEITERFVMPREQVLLRGDGSHELLWCVLGALNVMKGDVHITTIRSDLGEGQLVGETAFFLTVPQPYTVRATPDSDVKLLVFSHDSYEEIIKTYPEQSDLIVRNVLRKFGLSKSGEELNMESTGELDEDEAKELAEIKTAIRLAILERKVNALQQMFTAAVTGDVETIRSVVARGFDINVGDFDGRTTLHLAASSGHTAVVQTLCSLGAKIDARDRWEATPIADAVSGRHTAVAEELQRFGGVLEIAEAAARMHEAAIAGDLNYMTLLVSQGIPINVANHDGVTALHLASAVGNVRVVDYLLTKLADVNATDRWGMTAIDDAIANEQRIVTQLLAVNMAIPDPERMAKKMRKAANEGDAENLQFLVEVGASLEALDYDKRTPLHLVVASGSLAATHYLVGKAANVNAIDRWGNTPLVDALKTNLDAAAILVKHNDATLPKSCEHDQVLQDLYQQCIKLPMYEMIHKLHALQEERRQLTVTKNAKRREVGLTFNELNEQMHKLQKLHAALYKSVMRHTDHWISAYGLEEDDESEAADDEEEEEEELDGLGSVSIAQAKAEAKAVADAKAEAKAEAKAKAAEAASAAAAIIAGAAEADAPSEENLQAKEFVRLILRLPKAAAGLQRIKAEYEELVGLAAATTSDELARRRAEHAAVKKLIVSYGISESEAAAATDEIYRELKGMLNEVSPVHPDVFEELAEIPEGLAEVEPPPAHEEPAFPGLGTSANVAPTPVVDAAAVGAPADEESALAAAPPVTAPSKVLTDGDGQSTLLDGTRNPRSASALEASRRPSKLDSGQRASLLEQARRRASLAGPVRTLYLSEVGHVALFTSRKFVETLAARHARTVRTSMTTAELASHEAQQDLDVEEAAKAQHGRRSRGRTSGGMFSSTGSVNSPPGTPPGSPSRNNSRWRRSMQTVPVASEEAKESAAEESAQAQGEAEKTAPIGSVPEAAYLVSRMFRIFDRNHRDAIKLSDVRIVQYELGEMGGPEIKALLAALRDATGEVEALRSKVYKAMLPEDLPDDADALNHPEKQKTTTVKSFSRVHFVIGVSRWILSSAETEGKDGEEEDGERDTDQSDTADEAAAAAAATKLTLKLRSSADTGKRDPAAGSLPLKLSKSMAGKKTEHTAEEGPRYEDLQDALKSWAAYIALADLIDQRIDTDRLKAHELADPEVLLNFASHTVTLREMGPETAEHLRQWCEQKLEIKLAPPGHAAATASASAAAESGVEKFAGQAMTAEYEGYASWMTVAEELREQGNKLRIASIGVAEQGVALTPYERVRNHLVQRKQRLREMGNGGEGRVEIRPWYVLDHTSKFYVNFHRLFVACVMYDAMFVPIMLTFLSETSRLAWMPVLNGTIDALYWLRIVTMFCTSFVNENSVTIVDPKMIRSRYLMTDCMPDLIAALPQDGIALLFHEPFEVVYGLRLLRLLNLRHAWRMHKAWLASLGDDDMKLWLWHYISVLLLASHYMACFWNLLSSLDFSERSWLDAYTEDAAAIGKHIDFTTVPAEQALFTRYLINLYFVMSMITTLGLTQVPINFGEVVVFLVLMLLNLTIYAWCVGQISTLVMNQDAELVGKRQQIETVKHFLRHAIISTKLKEDIEFFFRAHVTESSGSSVKAEDMFAAMPVALQIDVSVYMYRAIVGQCTLLENTSNGFLNRLAAVLRERVLEEEAFLFRAGEASKELCIVWTGSLELTNEAEVADAEPEAAGSAGPGDTLGEVPFVFGIRHFQSARAAAGMESKVIVVQRPDYIELLKAFPDDLDNIMDNAIRQYDGAMTARSGRSKTSAHSSKYSAARSSTTKSSTTMSNSLADSSSDVSSHLDNVRMMIKDIKRKREDLMLTKLCAACANGELDKARRIISASGVSVNHGNVNGRRPLHLAACFGHRGVIQFLLGHRADVNVADRYGGTPLEEALREKHMDAAKMLEANGAKRLMKDPVEKLCAAAGKADGLETLRYILRYDTVGEVTCRDANRRTPLHVAAAEGHIDNVKLLLELHADINAVDRYGVTPLQDAVHAKHEDVCELLLARDANLGATFDSAAYMCTAGAEGNVAQLERLVKYRCNVNIQDHQGRTALHLASANGHVGACHFLLDCEGIDPNVEDFYGNTSLDDTEREESNEVQLTRMLLNLRGAKNGSHERAVRNLSEHAAKKRAEDMATVKQREQLCGIAVVLVKWVRDQRKAAYKFKKRLDEITQLENEEGPDAVKQTQARFWVEVKKYAARNTLRIEYFKHNITQGLDTTAESADDLDIIPLKEMRHRAADLVTMQESVAVTFSRLGEVDFSSVKKTGLSAEEIIILKSGISPDELAAMGAHSGSDTDATH